MRAVICRAFGPPEDLEWTDRDEPVPGPDEVLVDIRAAGVGFVDGLMVQGRYQVKPPLPYFPGGEFAGRVRTVGNAVRGLAPGTRVLGLGNGAFAQALCVRASACVPVPDAMDDATAAGFFINYATALYGLRDCGHVQPGEAVLVLGASGGVGSAAIAVARAMGAYVIAAASSPDKLAAARVAGAEAGVDYSRPDWRDALRALLPAGGLQVVWDPVGGAASEVAFRSLAPGGRLLVVGFASGTIPAIPLNLPLLKRSSIVGVDWGGDARTNPHINAELMATLTGWVAAGQLVPAPVQTRPMDDVREALRDQIERRVTGKLVLVA